MSEQGLFRTNTYNTNVVDDAIKVRKDDAFKYAQLLAQKEGALASISTGATLEALAQIQDEIPVGSDVLMFNCDTVERHWPVGGE